MTNQNTQLDTNAPKDPQEKYDENVQKQSLGNREELQNDLPEKFSGRFPRDFYRYSQDFHDREDGAPGIDQDFGTNAGQPGKEVIFPNQMPEGDGVAESQTDRSVREEIMDFLTRDGSLDADDVTVRVEDGVVTLSGSVDEERMKRSIEDGVGSVPGVDEVLNCLIINPPTN
jgi:hypothetical protein